MLGAARLVAFSLLLLSLAPAAHAQVDVSGSVDVEGRGFVERLHLRGEAGLGSMLSGHQVDEMDFGLAGQLSLRPGLSLIDPLAIQLAFSAWPFPSDDGGGRLTMLGLGVLLQPKIGDAGRLMADVNVGPGFTGDLTRLAFDVGLGFDFALSRVWHLGPVLRYGQVVTASGDVDTDAKFFTVGVSLTLRVPPAEPKPEPIVEPDEPRVSDRDGDGVEDGDDLCPDVAAGDNPDPARRGCPASDADGDGVFDAEDQCPTLPKGENPDPSRLGCPDGDDDQDGVLNSTDECRMTHAGYHPDPERPGCPLPDSDNDTVPDAVDACPKKAGAPHPDPKRHGCPSLVKIQDGMIRILKPVHFASNKDRILKKSEPVLHAVANALEATPEIKLVSIEGHTDDRGKDAFNLDLSERRAAGVRQWLIDRGIDPARLRARGFGETRPIESNDTREGRGVNRRVEFIVVDPPTGETSPATPGK